MRFHNGHLAAVALALCGATYGQLAHPPTQPAKIQVPSGTVPANSGLPPATPTIVEPPPPPATLRVPATAPAPASVPRAVPVTPGTSVRPRPAAARAGATPPPPETAGAVSPPSESDSTSQLGKVIVSAQADLENKIINVAPSLGAQTYDLGPQQIANTPRGENATFKDVLARAPGVVEDSFGQEHVRGEHANLTYRVNGVLLPEPLNGFGQELDTRLIHSVTLIDGSLPAQFGFHTAGIVDVQTKSGETLNHDEFSLYGGSFDTLQPSVQLGGTFGKLDYFITASYNHNDLGIENPSGTHRALHDYTDQERVFGYFAYRLDSSSRLSLLMNASYADFQIPNSSGVPQAFPLTRRPNLTSGNVDETQNEQEYYTVLSYQKSFEKLTFQLSGFTRYGQITFHPDPTRDLVFQGVAGAVYNSFITNGLQLDSSYILNDEHTIRAGLLADYTTENLNTGTTVLADGAATSDAPFTIGDNSGNRALEAGVYAQDEWRISKQFTLNYGLRYDRFDANFDDEDQLSPRINLVYKIDDATTAHAGYARYFVTPPVQDVRLATLRKFIGTTNAPANLGDEAPKVERSNYYDVGISHQFSKPLLVSVDGFYKQARNLVDLGQFGSPVILAPFNYRHATVYGAELSTTYTQGGFSAFGNFSWVQTMAHDINTQQFLIDPDELAFIRNHNIKLDHEAEFSISAGLAYAWKNDRVYLDFLYGSGLRAGFANTHQLQQHYPVNVGYEHVFHPSGPGGNAVKFRVDLLNVFDEKYELRDGSGIGVGAPQFGARRALFAGLTYQF